ncbi:MAG: nucleoside recognition protein [Gammaproteobacteria bacterium]|nr:nucleoside recognition protein [Gammaproteobacteria bacterium]
MLNIIWLSMMFLAIICGIFTNQLDQVVLAVTESAKLGFNIAVGLAAIMSLWLGIMKIASDCGLINRMSYWMQPLFVRLFPEVPPDHPAMGSMVMSIVANLFGLGNAATPFGLQAMKELQKLNTHVHAASDAMCMFVVLHATSLQLIPTSAIAYLALNGSHHPSSIIVSCLIGSSVSTIVAILSARQLAKLPLYKIKNTENL